MALPASFQRNLGSYAIGTGGGIDPLSLLSGVLGATGLNQVLPGGVVQDFSQTLWADPRQAATEYAQWRGPITRDGGTMQLPFGPWGPVKTGFRMGPARSLQDKFRQQAMMDMHRDVTKSLQQAPEADFLSGHIDTAMKKVSMNRLGMSKHDIQDRQFGARAVGDQYNAAWDDLNSLFPPEYLVPFMDHPTQDILRNVLTNARKGVADRMANPRGQPLRPGHAAPDITANARKFVVKALNQQADKHAQIANYDRAAEMRSGADLVQQPPGSFLNKKFLGGSNYRG